MSSINKDQSACNQRSFQKACLSNGIGVHEHLRYLEKHHQDGQVSEHMLFIYLFIFLLAIFPQANLYLKFLY